MANHRDEILGLLKLEWTDTPIFALDDVMSLDNLPPVENGCVLLVDFPAASEQITTIAVQPSNGFRDFGIVQLIIANPAGQGSDLARGYGNRLRLLLRGRRIGLTVIETVSTFSAEGLTDGKWQLFVARLNFYRDEC
jgi:hypothetical protein